MSTNSRERLQAVRDDAAAVRGKYPLAYVIGQGGAYPWAVYSGTGGVIGKATTVPLAWADAAHRLREERENG